MSNSVAESTSLRRYEPTSAMPWNVERVVHLHRRAGFAADWGTIQRDVQHGPDAAIERMLNAQLSPEFEQMSQTIGDAAIGSGDSTRLKAWWLYRMLFTSDPLSERLTLCWHNHFATSVQKVNDVSLMHGQNAILRKLALGNFSDLLQAIIRDPAMLIWLDADSNRKEHPNENLAREVMELFTLGVGNYSERDVKEGARALTGWTVAVGKFRSNDKFHDEDEKSILGKTGHWNGDDLLKILVEHPATPRRIAFRLCQLLLGESVLQEATLVELANGVRERDLDISWAVEKILRSELFFTMENMGNRVMSPVELLVSSARALEMVDPPPSTWLLAEWTKRLGEDLFNPPNVFGWPGGRAWLTSRAVIGRANFASALVEGSLTMEKRPFDARVLAAKWEFVKEAEIGDFYSLLLLGRSKLPKQFSSALHELQHLVVALLSSAEGQIG